MREREREIVCVCVCVRVCVLTIVILREAGEQDGRVIKRACRLLEVDGFDAILDARFFDCLELGIGAARGRLD